MILLQIGAKNGAYMQSLNQEQNAFFITELNNALPP